VFRVAIFGVVFQFFDLKFGNIRKSAETGTLWYFFQWCTLQEFSIERTKKDHSGFQNDLVKPRLS